MSDVKDSTNEKEPDEVWTATVDNERFRATVTWREPYKGTLTVTVVETGEALFTEEVGLAYNAQFGPDVSDVGVWQALAITAIDNWIATHD